MKNLLASFLAIVLGLTSAPPTSAQSCRCTSGSDCWPSDSEFQTLASILSQPLIHPAPPAAPCYDPASGNCTDVRAGWYNGVWRSDQPGASEHTNFETYTFPNGSIQACYLNTTLGAPCQQGSEAVKFAGNHNLRLVIKNTGHDYLGRSSARGSFLIWTHHIKNITFHDSFSPTGATDAISYANGVPNPTNLQFPTDPTATAFTFGAGVQWFEAYQAAKQRNRVIVGGISQRGSVGAAGGWLQGGGHSLLAPNYGLGVDNVLEFTIVTADGNHIVANQFNNQDLFWALRGGGGGTWGVVTSVTYKTHPSTPFSAAFLLVNSTDANSTQRLLTEVIRHTPSLVEQGYGGYSGGASNQFLFLAASPNATAEQTNATFRPLFDLAVSLPGFTVENYTVSFPDFWALYEPLWGTTDGQVGVPNEISSWLLPKDVIQTDKPEDLAAELLKISGFGYYLVTGGQVSRVDPDEMGLNPAWRKSMVYATLGTGWQDGADLTEINAARQLLIQDMKILEAIAPESGAYLNEASRYEFDWKKSFFGPHYDKLRAIKHQYDPDSIFLVHEGIGSDEWDPDLVCPV